ncbi:hypothetical protein EJ05DRAFT_530319 [Pseudovirgaria hyperparasitica]|uniref:Cell cycle control protein cwf19 n=1 Tax=Pseudovirgaria hyperparasitica TaxID=470096 RepID=A0A6A6WFU3_9PEZI|nr:uncharacterized protein EJ05DRAFT_530319 [Pseudovirgaria hyperparasitica]KAF2761702.1 hypothetical protein EJ05DRAFT_530319 [Pseudovirgaria hyperparasitica]
MGLDDFEKELAESKAKESHSHRKRDRSRSRDRHHHRSKHDDKHRHSHKHRSSRRESSRDRDGDSKHRHKRSRRDDDNKPSHKDREASDTLIAAPQEPLDDEEDEWVEKEVAPPPDDDILDQQLEEYATKDLKRDAWMEAPSSLDVDYVHKRKKEEAKPHRIQATQNDYNLKVHKNELNSFLKNVGEFKKANDLAEEPAQHEIDYTFGDSGSQWRMTKLKAVYRKAKETDQPLEEVALERYEDLRAFDDAREEEIELDRRNMYGRDYVGKEKPSGELFQERKMNMGIRREPRPSEQLDVGDLPQGQIVPEQAAPVNTAILDQTALNKLKAQMMKAKLRGAENAVRLEQEYNDAVAAAAANPRESDVVVLGAMDNRMLTGGRKGEVTAVQNKRGRERGTVVENEDMSIEDMVRQERRTRNQAGREGMALAERIAKDGKFDNDLDYMDENAEKLAKRVAKSEINLRNMAINDFQKMNRILDSCILCHHEDTNKPPVAPIVSLGTRVYLTLATEPELTEGGSVIVPIQHRTNLLECDDDEWEEIRNFMKCLTRMYHDQGREVLFYENAVAPQRRKHAAMMAVPIPYSLGDTAPAFFKEAMLTADDEWSQHKKIIDTLKRSREGMGRVAFRRSIAKEMPYFHVWFELDGGMGHVVENEARWPKGDLFAREIIGGMVDAAPDVIKRQGRWSREDRRVEPFRKRWRKFDWTRVLTDG